MKRKYNNFELIYNQTPPKLKYKEVYNIANRKKNNEMCDM